MGVAMRWMLPALAWMALAAGLPAADKVETLMRDNQCFACHAVDKKVVGPAYRDVARRYRGKKGAEARLCKKVLEGGSGVWGSAVMTPHPYLKDAEIKAMVDWILKRK